MMGEIVPHSMKNLSVGSMGGRVGLGRGQRRVSPPSLGLAHYSGLPGQGQEETRWTGSWKGRHTLHLSLMHIGTCVHACRAHQPICKSLRNNFATRPVPSRSRLKTAATKNSLLYGQWRAVRRAQGRSRGSLSCCQGHTSPTLGFPPNWGGVTWHLRQVTQFPAPSTYTVCGQE